MPKPTFGWFSLVTTLMLAACGGSSAPPSADAAKSSVASIQPETDHQETARINRVDALVRETDPHKDGAGAEDPVVQVAVDEKAGLSPTTAVDLGTPDTTQREQLIRNNRKSGPQWVPKAYQTGFARHAAPTGTVKRTRTTLKWSTTESGLQRARLRFTSSGAKAVRLGIQVESIPDTAVFRVYAEGSKTAQQTTGEHINRLIRANKQRDGDSQASRTYWTPAITEENSVLEIEVPGGSDTESLLFAIPTINHQVETALEVNNALIGAKATCFLTPDATCTTPLPPAANAVAAMDFVDGGNSYTCTGTLIANRGDTQQNYFLTANHCINTQNAASSLATLWLWRSNECNGSTPYTGTLTQSTGSIFLLGRPTFSGTTRNPIGTDTTLLKLNAQPPTGVIYAGWQHLRRPADSSTPYMGLHHPFDAALDRQHSDYLRRSDSRLVNYGILLGVDQQGYWLDAKNDDHYPMYEVSHFSGVTEPGSSGSALFADGSSNNPQIVGQLWGGASSCENPSGKDYYGRFDIAYEDGLV
uniref:trypsin-like serine peptidase n=1 Tax=Hydrogenophaga flava TaxID=65657 RepID=UPI000AAC9561